MLKEKYRLLFYLTSFAVCFFLDILKKALNMTSQLVICSAILYPNLKSEKKKPVNQLIKKFWPYGEYILKLIRLRVC